MNGIPLMISAASANSAATSVPDVTTASRPRSTSRETDSFSPIVRTIISAPGPSTASAWKMRFAPARSIGRRQ